jgi:hypothetical protein
MSVRSLPLHLHFEVVIVYCLSDLDTFPVEFRSDYVLDRDDFLVEDNLLLYPCLNLVCCVKEVSDLISPVVILLVTRVGGTSAEVVTKRV